VLVIPNTTILKAGDTDTRYRYWTFPLSDLSSWLQLLKHERKLANPSPNSNSDSNHKVISLASLFVLTVHISHWAPASQLYWPTLHYVQYYHALRWICTSYSSSGMLVYLLSLLVMDESLAANVLSSHSQGNVWMQSIASVAMSLSHSCSCSCSHRPPSCWPDTIVSSYFLPPCRPRTAEHPLFLW